MHVLLRFLHLHSVLANPSVPMLSPCKPSKVASKHVRVDVMSTIPKCIYFSFLIVSHTLLDLYLLFLQCWTLFFWLQTNRHLWNFVTDAPNLTECMYSSVCSSSFDVALLATFDCDTTWRPANRSKWIKRSLCSTFWALATWLLPYFGMIAETRSKNALRTRTC